MARVRSALRIKSLHDQVRSQAADLANLNRTLTKRVEEQIVELERIGRLKGFLPPQVAKLVSSGDGSLLESHRREISVVFCDLRGFTSFAEAADPEEVISVLREYHDALGVLVDKFEGTVERFTGDGLLVLFNDPLPCHDPSGTAVRMAVEMRTEVTWHFGASPAEHRSPIAAARCAVAPPADPQECVAASAQRPRRPAPRPRLRRAS